MAELNPYKSPKVPPKEPQEGSSTKRNIGFLTLVILTPLAVFLTGCISCLAVRPTVDAVRGDRILDDPQFPYIRMIVVGFAVFLIPPIIVLIVMGRWAIVTYHHEALERKKLKDPP